MAPHAGGAGAEEVRVGGLAGGGGAAARLSEAELRARAGEHAALFEAQRTRQLQEVRLGSAGDLQELSKSGAKSSMRAAGQVPPVEMSWANIELGVPLKKKKKKKRQQKRQSPKKAPAEAEEGGGAEQCEPDAKPILRDLSGGIAAGRLLAVMGPSGSGKTSFLNVLAGRVPVGSTLRGSVRVNGKAVSGRFPEGSAYVMQDDALFSCLSVRETMYYAADLRLPPANSSEKKREIAEAVITELGLLKCADTHIGNEFKKGVSGGERKRTNMGVEMLSNPSVILLDEPTSGLDSFQALNVMQVLRELALHGRTIVSTIHQPRSSIFAMFDMLFLISEGRNIYFGPAKGAVAYFGDLGFQCPAMYNPADYFMDLISLDFRTDELEQQSRERLGLLMQASDLLNVAEEKAVRGGAGGTGQGNEHPGEELGGESGHASKLGSFLESAAEGLTSSVKSVIPPRYATSFPYQFVVLFRRSWTQISRDKFPLIISSVQGILFGLIIGALYSETAKTQKNIQDRFGVLFFFVINTAFGSLFAVMNVFPAEKSIINRERAALAYHALPLYFAKALSDIPWRLPATLLTGGIAYWIVGLNPNAGRFGIFLLQMVLLSNSSQALGLLVSAVAPSAAVAGALGPFFTIVLLLFGGFYINVDSIPVGARWIQYLSHVRYAFVGLSLSEFSGQYGYECDVVCAEPGAGGEGCLREVVNTDGCLQTGEEILTRLSFEDIPVWEPLVGQLCIGTLFHIIAYVCLERSGFRFQPLPKTSAK